MRQYRHIPTGGIFTVLLNCVSVETGKLCVVYQSKQGTLRSMIYENFHNGDFVALCQKVTDK